MANGAEALLKTLFKAMGFDPAEMANGLQGFISHVYAKLDEFDKRMQAQENLMRQIALMLGEGKEDGGRSNVVALLPGTSSGVAEELNPSNSGSVVDSSDRATGTTGG